MDFNEQDKINNINDETQKPKVDNDNNEAIDVEYTHVNETEPDVAKDKKIYKDQLYCQWTHHTLNELDNSSLPEKDKEVDEDNNFNINFSSKSPTENISYKRNDQGENINQKKPKKRKGLLIASIVLGMVFIFTVVSSSVYVGYVLADKIEDRIEQYSDILEEKTGENNSSVDLSKKLDTVTAQNVPLTVPEIVQKVGPSVVSIDTKTRIQNQFMPAYGEGAGSGFVFEETEDRYYIATNNHVIEGAAEVTITINGETVNAFLQGRDPATDLAVIYINKSDLSSELANYIKVADLGTSEDLVVGELAVAIGNPLGLGETVTVGVISAINREITLDDGTLYTLVQTDAAINPGNSGGALVNGYGQIIGINTLKIGETDVEGIGFSIPTDIAYPVLNEIIEYGSVERPYIGILGSDVTEELQNLYGLPLGVVIIEVVPNGPSDIGGLQPYDVVTRMDGKLIKNMEDLKTTIEQYEIGDEVVVEYIREDRPRKTTLTLQGQ